MEASKKLSGMAIASLVLGIITIPGVFCCLGFATGILSVVFGSVALVYAHNKEVSPASKPMAWGGIIVSLLAMIGYIIYFIVILGGSLASVTQL